MSTSTPRPFDLERALDYLARDVALDDAPGGVPVHELTRSPASSRVGTLAAQSGLFQFHFEHRFHVELPETLAIPGADLEGPRWVDGVLPEPKYQSFRLDLPIGSFHPGHRAKWSTHELCHALVGFAWKPDASILWHATAGRLAETLPVVLWYFLDEVRLRRCPLHQGPTFRALCPDCEDAAAAGPRAFDEVLDREHLEGARLYLERELDAVAQTRRLGVPAPHIYGSLDLCSDGIAYAEAHGPRLRSPCFAELIERFYVEGPGYVRELDALEARVLEVAAAITEGAPLRPLADTPQAGRDRFARQDLAWRILQLREETEGDAAGELDRLVDALASGAPLVDVHSAYVALEEEYVMAPAGQVFAVGYPLDEEAGLDGRDDEQMLEGLRCAAPGAVSVIEAVAPEVLSAFVREDRFARAPLGERFFHWLSDEGRANRALLDLLAYEVALRVARGDGEARALGTEGEGYVLARGARVLCLAHDPQELLARVEEGEAEAGVDDDGQVVLAGDETPTGWALCRDRNGEVVIAELAPEDADVLLKGGALHDDVVDALLDLGVLARRRWQI